MKKIRSASINVPEPCQEDWNKMPDFGSGRYCSQCTKQILDFSSLTDEELLDVIQKSSGRLCGRLHASQLNRPIVRQATPSNRKFTIGKIAAGVLMLLSSQSIFANDAQSSRKELLVENDVNNSNPQNNQNLTDTGMIRVTGKVINQSDENLIANVQISIQGIAGIREITDANGNFQMDIPEHLIANDLITLDVQVDQYTPIQYQISRTELSNEQVIYFNPDVAVPKPTPMVMGIIMVDPKPKKSCK